MARVTRVAPRYLEALEREDFAVLPASVFTKGYIRAYCQAVGVPIDEALARYSESADVAIPAPAVPVAPPSSRPSDNGRRSRGTLLLSFVLLVGFGVALVVVALLLQSGRPEIGSRRAEPPAPRVEPESTAGTALSSEPPAASRTIPTPEAPPPAGSSPPLSASVSTPATPTPAARPPVSAPAPRPPDLKPAPPVESRPVPEASRAAATVAEPPALQLGSIASPYRLVARTLESTWLRVRTEDGRATEETIPAGEVREWISNRPFVLTIGNAAGIALELNGQKLPPLGGRGVVIGRLILPPAEP